MAAAAGPPAAGGPNGGADYTGGIPEAWTGDGPSDGGILCPMLDDVRTYVRAGIDAVAPGRIAGSGRR